MAFKASKNKVQIFWGLAVVQNLAAVPAIAAIFYQNYVAVSFKF